MNAVDSTLDVDAVGQSVRVTVGDGTEFTMTPETADEFAADLMRVAAEVRKTLEERK